MVLDKDLFTSLVDEYYNGLYNMTMKMLKNCEDTCDILQDAFMKVYVKKDSIKEPSKAKSYLFQTAFNLALNKKRDLKRIDIKNALFNEQNNHNSIDNNYENSLVIRNELDKLSEKQREVLLMKFFSGLKISEIAEILNISEGSVKTHLSRGLQHLKENLFPVMKGE